MKKILLNLAVATFTVMSVTACSSPSDSSNPSANPSTGATTSPTNPKTGTNGKFETRAAFIVYLNCLKTKVAADARALDIQIAQVNELTDAQWVNLRESYEKITQTYPASGC